MSVWVCANCEHQYDSEKGDLPRGIAPGTTLENLPSDWICPDCGAPKFEFAEFGGTPSPDGSGWTTANS